MSRVQIGPGPAPVRLAARVPAGALARRRRSTMPTRRAARGRPAVHPGDHQPHHRQEHGRAHRDHREGMEDRPRRAGRDRARRATAMRSPAWDKRLLRRPGDPGRRREARQPSRAATRRWRSWPSCRRPSTAPAARARLTAGNSSPLTDGAAAIWVASRSRPRAAAAAHAASETGRLGDRRGRFPRRGPADGAGLRHPAPARAPRPAL